MGMCRYVSDGINVNFYWISSVVVLELLAFDVNAPAGTDRPSSTQVAKYSRYNNGTNNITASTDRLPGNQLALYGQYNNRNTTSSILTKYSR